MKSKEEILTDLYALRATLSALSVEKDNYDKLEGKIYGKRARRIHAAGASDLKTLLSHCELLKL
ncbi:MAG TPA: hypothetical protein H9692_02480 [Firmicutes bacterium]|nr:hypothetical protein [Bacillota bacterium]